MTTKDYSLYRALAEVRMDALKEFKEHERQLTMPPLYGWSQEKHNAYHLAHKEKASQAENFCFLRMMQIDPD